MQLTKDLVPVVYHDFMSTENGTDSCVQDLTFEQVSVVSITILHATFDGRLQFQYQNKAQGSRLTREKRSNSLETSDSGHLNAIAERMAHTHFNKLNGFKANTRGLFIRERACSLDEIFRHVDKEVPMNIELSKLISNFTLQESVSLTFY